MSLKLCVVGCGHFARIFAGEMQAIAGEVDLSFASRNAQQAAEYAATFNGKASFGSYEAAAADSNVEAMYLCTPHHLHREHVALAAAAGKHILVEKPIARTMEEPGNLCSSSSARSNRSSCVPASKSTPSTCGATWRWNTVAVISEL